VNIVIPDPDDAAKILSRLMGQGVSVALRDDEADVVEGYIVEAGADGYLDVRGGNVVEINGGFLTVRDTYDPRAAGVTVPLSEIEYVEVTDAR